MLAAAGLDGRIAGHVKSAGQAIEQSIDADGLVAFWPKARGSVTLTAWAYSFLLSAQKAGEPVDAKLLDRLAAVLKQSLRSDYARLLTGSEMQERVEALAALAEGGKLDQAYAAELARRASVMPNASLAQVAATMAELPAGDRRIVSAADGNPMEPRYACSPAMGARSMAGLRAKAPIPLSCRPKRAASRR